MSQGTRLSGRSCRHDLCRPRRLRVELLEDRRLLSATRAAEAINQFAYDVYEHMQNESGNLFYSPLSVATALTMAYAGAAGQTAAEMEEVLHLGSQPGIHSSFNALLSIFETQTSTIPNFDLSVANAIWPALGLPVLSSFIDTIETDYRGHVQNLNYGNPQQAEDIINAWIEEQTHDKIQDMVNGLSPDTGMVLTNAVYFKGLWESPFDPRNSYNDSFYVESDETVSSRFMFTPAFAARTWLDGFDVLELPFEGGASSMVLVMPRQQNGFNVLSAELFSQIDAWLAGPQEFDLYELALPKFKTTVDTDLKELLIGMGMPTAFGGGADFSGMIDADVYIGKIYHKATIEVNEQGTEAAAATVIELPLCFAAGTPVLTPDGEKPIEELQAGDYVLARDEHNLEGGVGPKMVERLLNGQADILELSVGGQVIRTTALHPFFVRGRGWTPAGEIRVEDRLSTNHGDWIEVEKVLVTNRSEVVYNLRVADHRTYFVGSQAWKFGLWVHNYYDTGYYVDQPFHMMIRDNVTSTITFMGRINDPTLLTNELVPTVPVVNADFDRDNDVDGRDFLAWQRGAGTASGALPAQGDSNGDGDVDAGDLAAWQTAYPSAPLAPSADFDQDNDVDGRDFLAWQRGDGDAGDLAAWQASYGQAASSELAAVADTVLADPELFSGWLADESATDGEAWVIRHTVVLDDLTDPNVAVTTPAQTRVLDASISSRGRYAAASAGDKLWLDDELLERVFG